MTHPLALGRPLRVIFPTHTGAGRAGDLYEIGCYFELTPEARRKALGRRPGVGSTGILDLTVIDHGGRWICEEAVPWSITVNVTTCR